MGVSLRDVVYQTRVKLGELIPNFWADEDIIYDVNYGAQDMCSAAQNLETVIQFAWPLVPGGTVPEQEAALPVHVDQIFGVTVYSGQLYQLEAIDASDVQVANRVGNIPFAFYTKTDSRELSPQGSANTGDITVTPLPSVPGGQSYVTVLGLWPIPSSQYDTTVFCTRYHPWVTKPLDPIGVPARFIQGLIAYAVARSKEKESALDEAAYYEGIFQRIKKEFVDYCISHKQLKSFPTYGGTAWPTLARGSSSVIFLDQSPSAINP